MINSYSSHESTIALNDPLSEAIRQCIIDVIDVFSNLTGTSSILMDLKSSKILYKTEFCLYADDACIKDIQRESEHPYWALVPEEPMKRLLSVQRSYFSFIKSMDRESYSKHIFITHYPIMVQGHEVYIANAYQPILIDENGSARIGLFIISPSNKKEITSAIITPNGTYYSLDMEASIFIEKKYTALSQAEKKVLQRARIGMTNEEIAQSLFTSVNTVKTHKSSIFKKLGVKSISEALSVIQYAKW